MEFDYFPIGFGRWPIECAEINRGKQHDHTGDDDGVVQQPAQLGSTQRGSCCCYLGKRTVNNSHRKLDVTDNTMQPIR